MTTKEEVAQVIAYCDENKTSYKQRLSELGINPWNFYDAKRKYARKPSNKCTFEASRFGCSFVPSNTIKPQLLMNRLEEKLDENRDIILQVIFSIIKNCLYLYCLNPCRVLNKGS